MVISTPQMSNHHQLKEEKINVKCNNITLERVSEWKLIEITLDEHFQRDKHIIKRLFLVTFYTEKVKTIYAISSTKTTDRIVDILQIRLLQQFIYWFNTVPN